MPQSTEDPSTRLFPVAENEAARLAALARYGLTGASVEERFSRIARLAARILNTPVALLTVIGETYQDYIGTYGTDLTGADRSVALCSYTITGEGPNLVPDLREDARYADNPFVTGEMAVRAYAGVPLLSAEGLPVGSLCAVDFSPHPFSDEDRAALADLGVLAAEEIERTLDAQRASEREAALTAQREAVSAREAERRRLDTVLDSLPAGVVIADASSRITHVNPAGERIFAGARFSEDVGDYGEWRGYWPDTGARLTGDEWALARALKRGEVITGERIDIERFDGTWGAIMNSGAPIRDEEGRIVGAVVAFLDVTAQRELEASMRRSEAHLRLATEAAGLGTWEWFVAEDRVVGNARLAEFFSLSPEVVEGGGPITEFLAAVHPDDLVGVQSAIEAALSGDGAYESRYRIVGKQGIRWVQTNGRVDAAADGSPAYFPGVVQDVTAQMAAEEALRHQNRTLEAHVAARTEELQNANRELELRNKELQDFAYVASHDLQEPLRKIQSFAGLLTSEHAAALGPEGGFYLQRINDAASRMGHFVRDLLALSRVSTQGRVFEPVDLGETLDRVMSDLELRLAETGGRVEVGGSLPTIQADPLQIHQLLLNLVGNALKFVRAEVPPRVGVKVEENASAVRLVVEDNGVGFADKDAERIFAPFQRLHGRAEYEGTGMGLAIVRRIVERHGGKIVAEGHPGAGARFVVTLPRPDPKA